MTPIRCHGCGGDGLVSAYTADGSDFLGADECRGCNGTGVLWLSPSGHIFKWPGGPLAGRISKAEMSALKELTDK